jgi:hypothetical protein
MKEKLSGQSETLMLFFSKNQFKGRFFKNKFDVLFRPVFHKASHTEKVSNTTRGCRLWDVKNSGYKNSSSTEMEHTFIHQNLSIFIPKN